MNNVRQTQCLPIEPTDMCGVVAIGYYSDINLVLGVLLGERGSWRGDSSMRGI